MLIHEDLFSIIDKNLSLEEKLKIVHGVLCMKYPFVHRISVALYDESSDALRTFLSSSGADHPLEFYEARLEEAPSLKAILKTGKPRVINDLSVLEKGEHEHTKSIIGQGYRASYTITMHRGDQFSGFIFFNSKEANCFDEDALRDLDVYAHLISGFINLELEHLFAIMSALKKKSAESDANETRDEQTLRLARVSRFVRTIAIELARSGKYNFTDAEIEEISWFSPFHLLSKVYGAPTRYSDGIAAVLCQNAQEELLQDPNWLESAIQYLGFNASEVREKLKNIARYYHENVDGTGYPEGLKKEQIPIEARIVCVADLFDAMTGLGAGMQAWSNEAAFRMLERLSKEIVDEDCVQALIKNRDKIEQIQARFMEVSAWVS